MAAPTTGACEREAGVVVAPLRENEQRPPRRLNGRGHARQPRRVAEMPKGTCSIEGCGKATKTLGTRHCSMHAERLRLHGTTDAQPPRWPPLAERYESYVDRSGGPDACHPWTGTRNHNGYGQMGVGSKGDPLRQRVPSRVGWELAFGPIPDGLNVCHKCDNPPCQNPRHWFLGTHQDNSDDKIAKDRHARGTRHGLSKLTDDEVREIRRLADLRVPQQKIAERFGICRRTVRQIRDRERWAHLP